VGERGPNEYVVGVLVGDGLKHRELADSKLDCESDGAW